MAFVKVNLFDLLSAGYIRIIAGAQANRHAGTHYKRFKPSPSKQFFVCTCIITLLINLKTLCFKTKHLRSLIGGIEILGLRATQK